MRLPDFLIIGVQKGGTTSLYEDLLRHPGIAAASYKEIHYFDLNYAEGTHWYAARFPENRGLLTGEATPYYIFHPLVAERVNRLVPDVRLIVLLRNPVDRAYSHYQMIVRSGGERLDFEQALLAENSRIEPEERKILTEPHYNSRIHQYYSYRQRGIYVDQLQRWLGYFATGRILVLNSERYALEPQTGYRKLLEFLRLDPYRPADFTRSNAASYPPISGALRRELSAFYRRYNEKLFDLIGEDFDWD